MYFIRTKGAPHIKLNVSQVKKNLKACFLLEGWEKTVIFTGQTQFFIQVL